MKYRMCNFKKITIVGSILGYLSFLACGEEPTTSVQQETIDRTTICQTADEKGAYTTWYKPAIGWVGDPIPFYDNGKFYILYLQDWRSNFPFLHPWHMVSTTDLSSFTFEGEVIPCGAVSDQDVALGTGGVIKSRENGKYYAFYTGHQWTPAPGAPVQAVLLTTSSDMKNWTKDKSFFLSLTGALGYNINECRDPHVFYDDEQKVYKMVVTANRYGKAALATFSSPNLKDWTLQEPLYTDQTTFALECADVFKAGDYWYITYSNIDDRMVHYRYSRSLNGPWTKPANSAFDGIGFYAGKTMSNGKDRYLAAWCPTRIGNGAEDQWGGSLVCHKMIFNSDGTIDMAIAPGINEKFQKKKKTEMIAQKGIVLQSAGSYKLGSKSSSTFPRMAKPCKIETTIQASGNEDIFGFIFGDCSNKDIVYPIYFNLKEKTLSMYRNENGNSVKQTQVPLAIASDKQYRVKIVAEKSVCVVYVNDKVAFTNRIDKMPRNPWSIFSEQGENVVFSSLTVFEN